MPPSWLRGASRYLINHSYKPQFYFLHLRTTFPSRKGRNSLSCTWRNASSLSSSTAINASKTIPTRYKELHDDLQAVKKNAAAFVDLSRLELALQGLETENFTTRIAVLGINDISTARRVVRLLLADPLEKQEAWEVQLDGLATAPGILLKYGKPRDTSLPPQRTAIETLSVQSRFLERHNLEILIGSINSPDIRSTNGNRKTVPIDVFLSPAVDIPTSSSGRLTPVRFPVHKSVLLANGFRELLQIFQLLSATDLKSQGDHKSIECVFNTEGSLVALESESVVAVNFSKANQGLEMIRKDLTKAPDFEHHWLASGLDSLVEKLSLGDNDNKQQLSPLLKNLIQSTLGEASSAIASQAYQSSQIIKSNSISEVTRVQLQDLLSSFCIRAHAELQSGIEAACSSVSWKKLAWYKLFWRVDDVPLIVSDLVERYWLPQSERAICELTGRLIQAGLSPDSPSTPSPALIKPSMSDLMESRGLFWDLRSSLSATKISDARRALTLLSSSDLTTKAQSSLAKMLAFSGGSAVFATLSYVSSPFTEFYESGAVLAFGLVFALRKLQIDWESYRRHWRQRLFEAGSDTLKEVENQMRRLINNGGKASEDVIDTQLRAKARDAVDSAQEALKRLK